MVNITAVRAVDREFAGIKTSQRSATAARHRFLKMAQKLVTRARLSKKSGKNVETAEHCFLEIAQKLVIHARLSRKARKTSSKNVADIFTQHVFDLFKDVSGETPTLEAIVGAPPCEQILKSRRFGRGCPEKVKITLRGSAVQGEKLQPSYK